MRLLHFNFPSRVFSARKIETKVFCDFHINSLITSIWLLSNVFTITKLLYCLKKINKRKVVEVPTGGSCGSFSWINWGKDHEQNRGGKGKRSLCWWGLPINSKKLGNRLQAYHHKPADGDNGEREYNDDFRWVPNRNEGVFEIKP